jgi:hypothetical protein
MQTALSRLGLMLVCSALPFLSGCIAAMGAVTCGFTSSSNYASCIDDKYNTSFSRSGPTAPSKPAKKPAPKTTKE